MLTFAVKKKRTSSITPKRHALTVSTMTPSLHLQKARVRHILRGPTLQPKLTIGQPNDKHEQEADRVAEQVTRMPEPQVQRQPLEEEEEEIQTKPLAEQITPLVQRQAEEEEETIQAKEGINITQYVNPRLGSNPLALKSSGEPLSKSTRAFFEPRLGYDFNQIRIHSDSRAAKMARAVNARAFTVGRNVVFGEGQHSPETAEGKRLIGHELAHVIQQRKSSLNTRFIQFQQAPQQQPAVQNVQQAQNVLTSFTGTNFTGAAVQCDVNFVQHLQTIDSYAGNRGVQIHVTSSFRQQQQAVTGAVVQPVTNSNHHAGHAIDMNVRYQGTLYTSTQLQSNNLNNLPQAVQGLIDDIRNDTDLRWGGDFANTDPVHIDDGLNINDPTTFQQRVTVVQAAAQAAQPAAQPAAQ